MELNQSNNSESTDEANIQNENIENLNYLYPNGHRMTHQMRWFKGIKDIRFESDIAA
tara:strand:+ start:422 stop:592 length:171 start_codon:yes stop_codon:yes gene_type:complete